MIRSYSPQRPDDVVVETAESSAADVARTFDQARVAQRDWLGMGASGRAGALSACAESVASASEDLAQLIVREVGKPVGEARGEVARAVAILRYYSQQVYDPYGNVHEPSLTGILYTRRRPLGVAGLVTPWNFPIAIPLWKAAPALAFGNAVVLKPAPEATGCALKLTELLKTHLPDGLLTVTPGGVDTGRAVVEGADAVSFTGSTTAGRSIAATAVGRGIRVQAEMGGQNPAIIMPDADIDAAASQIAGAAMAFAGQKCTATKRVIVVGDASQARDALVHAIGSLKVGDPGSADTVIGPLISEGARERVMWAAADARRLGGKLLTGGSVEHGEGWFAAPTLVEDVPSDHILSCDEVFGPICTLTTVPDLDEAIRRANDVQHGLAAALYTSNLAVALTASERLEAGLVKVNAPTSGVDSYLPFGGEKASSFGPREQGKSAQDFYTSLHTVTIASN